MKQRMPDFLIIGAQKCGTTSFYNHLIEHPNIEPGKNKEIHFFDNNYNKGLDWYISQFPSLSSTEKYILTGEATPKYIFHPLVPKRVFSVMPQVKLIALLRNPIDRAYSQYQMALRRRQRLQLGNRSFSFEEVIEKELKQAEFSYLKRGVYVNQIERWLKFFPRMQLKVVKSEDLFSNPSKVYKEVISFLGLPSYELKEYNNQNSASYQQMEIETRRRLIEYYKPYNKKLYEVLGQDFGWDN
ncbi:sulfotransferase domain-containing protein [Alkalihalobacillus sp. BA299]|uniref:sulfotransferase domain-containing protein n=1 Tax=Alkalihalobacillus sp. BA299 TaxID=2815938 RepID=UPI001ADC3670|nr:sulfotransferase domain-containing protein [Alkalihalobacillus sp. BA299]